MALSGISNTRWKSRPVRRTLRMQTHSVLELRSQRFLSNSLHFYVSWIAKLMWMYMTLGDIWQLGKSYCSDTTTMHFSNEVKTSKSSRKKGLGKLRCDNTTWEKSNPMWRKQCHMEECTEHFRPFQYTWLFCCNISHFWYICAGQSEEISNTEPYLSTLISW